jgi:hypothetical protein
MAQVPRTLTTPDENARGLASDMHEFCWTAEITGGEDAFVWDVVRKAKTASTTSITDMTLLFTKQARDASAVSGGRGSGNVESLGSHAVRSTCTGQCWTANRVKGHAQWLLRKTR